MELQIDYVQPDQLRAAEYNPRKISASALATLAGLMDEHGFVTPVIARRSDGLILGGHQRIRANALRREPDRLIPCVFISGLDDVRAKALNIALNNPGAQGVFDDEMLAEILGEIRDCELNASALTGFAADEVEQLTAILEEYTPAEDIDQLVETDAAGLDDHAVMLVFEMSGDVYAKARGDFDTLIAKHDLSCHFNSPGS